MMHVMVIVYQGERAWGDKSHAIPLIGQISLIMELKIIPKNRIFNRIAKKWYHKKQKLKFNQK